MATSKIEWPTDDELLEMIAALGSKAAAARSLDVSVSTLKSHLDLRGLEVPVAKRATARKDIPSGEVDEREILESELRDLRKRVGRERKIDVQAEKLLHEVREAFRAVPARFKAAKTITARSGHKRHAQAILLSDLHCGEVVQPEAVNGLNEFNFDVLQKRMDAMGRSMVSFGSTRDYPIEELHVWLLGDNLSGNIHDELQHTNEFPVTEQCWRVADMIANWIEQLVPHYPKITVSGVSGNHPRTQKEHASKRVYDNFDWLGFKIIETRLGNYDSIECHFPQSGFEVVEIAGLKILLWHGDGVRTSMPGVPWGGMMRRWNELRKQYGQQGINLDGLAVGHYHQANVVQGQIFMNGSVIGLNEYGLKNFGSGEKPTQLLLTFQEGKSRLTDVSFLTP